VYYDGVITTAPEGGSFNFSNNTLTKPTAAGWQTTPFAATTTGQYVSTQTFTSTNSGASVTWSTPVLYNKNGTDGAASTVAGPAGITYYTAKLWYQQSSSPTAGPIGTTYNFSNNTFGSLVTNWVATQPASSVTIPTYSSTAVFSTTTPTSNSAVAGTWSAPIIEAQLGSKGDSVKGDAGKSAVRAFIKVASGVTPTAAATTDNTSTNLLAPSNASYTWSSTVLTLESTDTNKAVWQIDGILDGVTVTWASPYLSYLKVDSLEAYATKTGRLLSKPVNNGSAVLTINSTPDGLTETNEFRTYNGVSIVTSIGDGLISGQSSMSALDGGSAGVYTLAKEVLCYLNTNNAANASSRFLIGLNLMTKSYTYNGTLTQYAGGQVFRSRASDDAFNIDLGFAKRVSPTVGNAEVLMGGRFYTKMDDAAANNLVAILSGDFSKLATDTDVYRHLPVTSAGNTIFNTANANSLAGQKAAGIFSDNTTTVFLCDTSYAINVKRGGIKGSGNISVSGNITAYDGSDKRIKENIKPIENALSKLKKISGNTFKWIESYYDKQDKELFKEYDVGVIAQEVQAVLPEAVHERSDGVLAVNYVKLIPLLIEAIKEQQVQIEELKDAVTRLSK
jgi:hypothetical protein